MKAQCPGQDPRFWKIDDIKQATCPQCHAEVEFFKDDLSRKCPACGARFKNPHLDMGCAEWCAHAKECLDSLYRETDAPAPDQEETPDAEHESPSS